MTRKILLIVCFIVLFTLFRCAYYNTFFNAKRYYRQGHRESLKNRTGEITRSEEDLYKLAIEKALKLLAFYPDSKYVDDALLILGKSNYYLGQDVIARQRLEELIEKYPGSPLVVDARLWLAKIAVAEKEYTTAHEGFNRLLRQKIDDGIKSEIYYNLGNLYEINKDYQHAIESYQQVIATETGTHYEESLFSIAADYEMLGNYQKAGEYIARVIDSKPPLELDFEARFKYAQIQKKMNRLDDAKELFEALLKNALYENWFSDVKLEIADCLILKDEIENGIAYYRAVIEDHQKTRQSADAFYRLGKLYEKEKSDYETALNCYVQVKQEFSASQYADSAEVKKKDIQRLMALREIIRKAKNGEKADDLAVLKKNENIPDEITNEEEVLERDQHLPDESEEFDSPERGQFRGRDFGSRNRAANNKNTQKSQINPELKNYKIDELDKNLFLLAELFLFRFNFPDSAKSCYSQLVSTFPESPYSLQALYNMAYISEVYQNRSQTADSLYHQIMILYPDTYFAAHAREKLGMEKITTEDDSIRDRFLEAERLLYEGKDSMLANDMYKSILRFTTDSTYLARAIYALGWIAENHLHDNETAFDYYQQLFQKYPESIYAQSVREKVDSVIAERQKKENENVSSDSSIQIPPEENITVTDEKEILLADKTKSIGNQLEKIQEDAEKIKEVLPKHKDVPVRNVDKNVEEQPDYGIQVVPNDLLTRKAEVVGGIRAIQNNINFPLGFDKNRYDTIVVLQVLINQKGEPVEVELVDKKEDDMLLSVLRQAVNKTAFEAAKKDELSVASWLTLQIPINDN